MPYQSTGAEEYLEAEGARPGMRLTALDKAPCDGPITVQLGTRSLSLGFQLAGPIIVDPP